MKSKNYTSITKAILTLKSLNDQQKSIYKDFIENSLDIHDYRALRRSSNTDLKHFALDYYQNYFKITTSLEQHLATIYDIPLHIIEQEFEEATERDIDNPYIEDSEIMAQEFLLFHKELALTSPLIYVRTLLELLLKQENTHLTPYE